MEEEHFTAPFSCLPVHSLLYGDLLGPQRLPGMPFAHSPLPSSEVAAAPSPRLPALASQAGPVPSQPGSAHAGEPDADSAPYTGGAYPQDGDKEVLISPDH